MSENVSSDGSDSPAGQPPTERADTSTMLKRFPTTMGLIGFTSLVFIAQLLTTEPTGSDLISLYGAKINYKIAAGEVWRLITPVFIHGGIWHFFVNMYSLYALGPAVERLFSSQRMLVVYLLSGISGVILSFGFSPRGSIGASGAIFGLLGSLGTFIYRHKDRLGPAGRIQLRQIVFVALLNLGLGLMPMIDNWGHLGGLLAGIILTWTVGPRLEVSISPDQRPRLIDQRPWNKARPNIIIALVVLVLLAFAASQSPFT